MQKQIKFKITHHEKWWYVNKRIKWDLFEPVSKHCREDLAIKQMRRLQRREMRA